MARARLLKPGFFQSDELSLVSFEARLLFAGLWTIADREGRMEDRPLRIKAQVFPFDDVDVDALLTELHDTGLIVRYTVDRLRCIWIPTFTKHQKIHQREAESDLPPYQGDAEPPPSREKVMPSRAEALCGSPYSEAEAFVGNRAMALDAPSAKKVTTAFLERMSVEHPALDVDHEWERASNHKAYDKAKDKQRYFQNWLKRAEEFKARDKPPPSQTNGHGKVDTDLRSKPWVTVVEN